MKTKVLLTVLLVLGLSFNSSAQRGIRIAYIDTEYILENIEEYKEASSQLDKKVLKWKGEIDTKLKEIDQLKENLKNERVLLTKELIEEREEDIAAQEADILDYQQKRFGHNGDLMIQKKKLIQPVQDQVFNAVREIAKARKYDFVFDKSADVVMLYSNKKYDISDLVIRSITRASKRNQAKNRREKNAAKDEEAVPEEIDPDKEERQRILDEKKAERAKAIEERKKKQQELRDKKKKEFEERRKKLLEEREAKKKAREAARSGGTTEENNEGEGQPANEEDNGDDN